MTWTHGIVTPKPCQDRKVAAIRDAYDTRGIRVFYCLRLALALRLNISGLILRNADPLKRLDHSV